MKNQKKLFLSGVLTVGCTLLLLLWKTAEEDKKNDRSFAQESEKQSAASLPGRMPE